MSNRNDTDQQNDDQQQAWQHHQDLLEQERWHDDVEQRNRLLPEPQSTGEQT